MADYTIDLDRPQTRRLRYFNNQLLRDQDFIDEQRYHVDRLRRATRALLTPGRVHGLTTAIKLVNAAATVSVGPGAAVDRGGRWLVLAAPAAPALDVAGALAPDKAADGTLVGLVWSEVETDAKVGNDTRFDETPKVALFATKAALDGTGAVHLATLNLDDGAWSVTPGAPAGLGVATAGALTVGHNPLRFTSKWSGSADASNPELIRNAEIANDTDGFKALMIVGNSSSGARTVKIFDNLSVNAGLTTRTLAVTDPVASLTVTALAAKALTVSDTVTAPRLTVTDLSTRTLAVTDTLVKLAVVDLSASKLTANDLTTPRLTATNLSATNLSAVKLTTTAKVHDLGLLSTADAHVEIGTGAHPVRFTSKWSGFSDASKPELVNNVEIANDTDNFKALMIVGNSSSGARTVKIFDNLSVNAGLTTRTLTVSDPLTKLTVADLSTGKLTAAGPAHTLGTLTTAADYIEIGTGQNPLRFTSKWSSFTDTGTGAAEIANDTTNYKALMIVGNKAGDGIARRVCVYDELYVGQTRSGGPYIDFKTITITGNYNATARAAVKVTRTVELGWIPTEVAAVLCAFNMQYTNGEHSMLGLGVLAEAKLVPGKSPEVTLTISLRDASGTYDDPYDYSATILVIAKR